MKLRDWFRKKTRAATGIITAAEARQIEAALQPSNSTVYGLAKRRGVKVTKIRGKDEWRFINKAFLETTVPTWRMVEILRNLPINRDNG